ncbi:homocysteine S-methyltransferase family protein [Desulfitobacterium sp.]|uniref:homocysteine S-methyltransferase family protein n=1 Tax=Desulfitobacterium sp. TaxID=49981 RepID=UPI002B20BE93|nr:homocysteine S-methyltransferase family protein [Desulfitobacterium sp.]MEA4901747.1 homocysteine S-methyltransferase family protein [Desulfitobacterium sp.]
MCSPGQSAKGQQTTDTCSFATDMLKLQQNFSLKIFGGCCGTNNTHIRETARRLKRTI